MDIRLAGANSLKDKRRIIKSLITRIRNSFNVSISEVDSHDLWQRAGLGAAFVTSDVRFCQRVLSKVVVFVEREKRLTLLDSEIEII